MYILYICMHNVSKMNKAGSFQRNEFVIKEVEMMVFTVDSYAFYSHIVIISIYYIYLNPYLNQLPYFKP